MNARNLGCEHLFSIHVKYTDGARNIAIHDTGFMILNGRVISIPRCSFVLDEKCVARALSGYFKTGLAFILRGILRLF